MRDTDGYLAGGDQPLNRDELRLAAQSKLEDAKILFAHKRTSSAYYLCGYAVELALKACIVQQIISETLPDKALVRSVYSHDFPPLVGLAGLSLELKSKLEADPAFSASWAIVREWLPDARYRAYTHTEAQTLIEAVEHPESGVLKWITRFW